MRQTTELSDAAAKPATRPIFGIEMDGVARALVIVAIGIQLIQLIVHLTIPHPVFLAELLQAVAAAISALVCYHKAHVDKPHKHLWVELGIAFSIWAVAEIHFAFVTLAPAMKESQFSNFLWLVFAFPILLVTSYTPQSSRRDPAGWLDAIQAFLFFSILFGLVFPIPGIISQQISDDVQGVALLLVLILRYSSAEPGRDKAFFRNLTAYMAVYLFFCVLYYAGTSHGMVLGSIVELCWTTPFTFFSLISLCTDLSGEIEQTGWAAQAEQAGYVQGMSALGLAVMSLLASAVLAYHRPIQGYVALGLAFLLFAARTSAKEWQLQSVYAQLKHTGLHDPLTAIANRTLLNAEITQRLACSFDGPARQSHARQTSVLFIGLDRFKPLNDCLGHAFGDLLLKRVAELLIDSIRSQDLVARYGGDEFVILLDAVDEKDTAAFAERILDILRSPIHLESRLLYVTASIGFTTSCPGTTSASMLQKAHFAMHHAKKTGRDRACAFEPEMRRIPQYKLALETDLRKGLANDEISPFYQPIFSVATGEITGFEALAHWDHPQRGEVCPQEFIPIAEDTGLIIALGHQIMVKACRQCREWNRRFSKSFTMNVNVSAHQFAGSRLFEQILGALYESGLEARFLKLEITESVLISGYSNVLEVLQQTQKLGIQICLDDFGTGYSSLSYLLDYPFDVVKIDQSFVRHLDQDPRRAEVVRTLVELAARLNKHLVAEGVERPEEMACLREFGCELVQGFLLSRPVSVEAATELIQSSHQLQGNLTTMPAIREPLRNTEISAAS